LRVKERTSLRVRPRDCTGRVDGEQVIVLDTHPLIWWVDGASKLSWKPQWVVRVHARLRDLFGHQRALSSSAPAVPKVIETLGTE
jgi:hypothetical protein